MKEILNAPVYRSIVVYLTCGCTLAEFNAPLPPARESVRCPNGHEGEIRIQRVEATPW